MKYVSMLRGINVSGQKKIKMSDLTSLYESKGLLNVVTYIQSGNVIFEAATGNSVELKEVIEAAIEDRFEFHVPVEIRTHREIEETIRHCPYGPVNMALDGSRVLVTFLSSEPSEDAVMAVQDSVLAPEELVVRGRVVYLHCPNGYGKSKLSNSFIERRLGVAATTRNWKTVHKLCALSDE